MSSVQESEYERIFLAASRLKGKERERFLDDACREEPEVRLAVEKLLANADETRSIGRTVPTFRHETKGFKGQVRRRGLEWVERRARAMLSPTGALCALLFLAVTGFWSYNAMQEGIEQIVEEGLLTYLDNNAADIDLMVDMRRGALEYFASAPRLTAEAEGLLGELASRDMDAGALRESARSQTICQILDPLRQGLDMHGFWIVDRSGSILVSNPGSDTGRQVSAEALEILEPAFAGGAVRQLPIAEYRLLKDADQSVLFPVTFGARLLAEREDGSAVVLVLLYDPKLIFGRMFRSISGETDWDTFAFDETGTLISDTIYLPQLKAVGIVPDGADAPLRVQLRDPGGDLLEGFANDTPAAAWPLTEMAASALAGESGVDLDGYRNTLGVKVLGAWTWLPEYDIGLAVEFRSSKALALTRPLVLALGGLFALIIAFTVSMVGLSYAMKVMRQRMEADQLGQYTLIEKIGEGGMGTVYKARHSMLRRDTAVKILSTESIDAESIARFEREVQGTSQLAHPNTIEVYDYGHDERTGIFFYAMEYLDGLTLADLLAEDGPQSAARIVHILKQACGSLAEAHEAGLIHRDIKPLNIMLCQRGGMNDVIKVLDFGLVADAKPIPNTQLTADGALKGTPLYIAPERVLNPAAVDTRSDIYSLGTVAYNLLTGKEIFEGQSSNELLDKVLREAPAPPSEMLGQPLNEELERLVMTCLDKDPENRPASMRAILAILDSMESVPHWTQDQSGAWWTAYHSAAGNPLADSEMRTGAEVVSDSGDESRLHAEAVAFTRYLLRVDPPPEVTARYVEANRALLSEAPTQRDRVLLETCLARPWTLPFLDAAEARRDPPSLLRKKVLVLSAVLETTTQFAPHFLPLKRWGPALFLELGVLGSVAVFRMLGGMVLVRALPGLRA